VTGLAGRLRTALAAVPGVAVRDLGRDRCGIVSFTVEARKPVELRDALRARRINVSVTSRSSTRLDMEARGLDSMVRASVHYYNTDEEVQRFVGAVNELSGRA